MKVYVESYGCSTNQALGEYLEGALASSGYGLVRSPEEADTIIINTCTVKARTERRMIRRIRELHDAYGGKKLVIAGCMPTVQSDLLSTVSPGSMTFGTYDYDLIPDAITNRDHTKGSNEVPYHVRDFRRPGIGIVPISTGCLGSCAYCIVRLIKGKLRSYPLDEILKEIERCRDSGAHEIWLTSQDLAAYGFDGSGVNLPGLLRSILDLIGSTRIRLGMMNPSTLIPILDELLEVYRDPRIYSFGHIPLQSGSDGVLRSMMRGYTVGDWTEIIDRIRSEFPSFTISTDIIIGYPDETQRDFEQTIRLMEGTKPDIINLSRYEPRPGTAASQLKSLQGSEVKRRSRIATESFRRITLQANRRWLGWRGECMISEIGLRGGYVARNHSYKPIILNSEELIGSTVDLGVVDTTENYLIGSKED